MDSNARAEGEHNAPTGRSYVRASIARLGGCLALVLGLALPLQRAGTVSAAGMTYDVAPSGSDTNDCLSPNTPCLTIGAAIARTAPGDTVVVAPGMYHERVSIAHDLTLAGGGADQTVLDGNGAVTGTLLALAPATTATVSGVTIRGGTAGQGYGGGVTSGGALTLAGDVVRDNTGGSAGGIYQFGGSVTISGSVVSGNSGDTGGIDASNGALTLISSTVSANSGAVGGIGVDNTLLTLSASTVSGNSGGGIANAGAATLMNSTVTGNIGSGLDNLSAAALFNSTVSGNSGVGVFSEGSGPVSLANTIVGGNIGPDCSGTLTSLGYNLLGSAAGCAGLTEGVNGDRVGLDPRLGLSQHNGGATATQALLPGSPAIDGGNPTGCTDGGGRPLTTDQRGAPRPDLVNARCDIGAYEEQAPPVGVATPLPVPTAVTASPTTTAPVTPAVPSPAAPLTTTVMGTPPLATTRPRATPTRPLVPPLSLYLGAHVVTSGATLSIRLGTQAHARVRITLQATATSVVVAGSGAKRHRVTRHVVLYRAVLNGIADARGGYNGRLRIGYRPARPAPASLTATIQTARGQVTRTATITIEPPRPPRASRRP